MAKYRITAPDGKTFDIEGDGTADEALAHFQANYKAATQEAKPLPANAGMANFAATVAGLPGDTLENVANLGIAAYGAAKGAITGDGGASPEPLKPGSLGGTEFMRERLRRLAGATGMEGFSPDNPNPADPVGTAQYTFASRGGFVPGGALPAAGSMVAEGIGGPQWAGVGAMLPTAAITAFNEARAPKLAAQQVQNANRDRVLKQAREDGLVVPPSEAGAGMVSNAVESVGGKAPTRQAASNQNAEKINRIAARSLDIPDNIPLTDRLLEKIRLDAGRAYQKVKDFGSKQGLRFNPDQQFQDDIASIGGQYSKAAQEVPELLNNDGVQTLKTALNNRPLSPAAAVELSKKLRADASKNYKAFDDAGKLELADAQRSAANAIESFLERQLSASGAGNLVSEFQAARQKIARTHDVEAALNGSNIDAKVLVRLADKGKPIGGGLDRIAEFAREFPNAVQLPQKAGSAEVGNLRAALASGAAAAGTALGGPIGGLVGFGAAMGSPIVSRSVLLSPTVQNRFANPSYSPAMTPASGLETLLQQSVIANQR